MLKQLIQSRVNRMANLRKELRKLTKKTKPKLHGNNQIFPFKTQLRALDVAMFNATKQWEELSAKDFSQYDCVEDTQ